VPTMAKKEIKKLRNWGNWRWIGVGLLGGLLGAGLLFYLRKPKTPQVSNFQECLKSGYLVMESYPRRCRTAAGKVFVEESKKEEKLCVDLCGDGVCQEVVCLGENCPCAETKESCPQDCQ